MKFYKHEASGAQLYKEIAQPHVSRFAEVFTDFTLYDSKNQKHNFAPRYISGQNIAGNLYKDCKAIFQNGKRQDKHQDERMAVGPYCTWRDKYGQSLSVSCADWVLSRILERTIIIGEDHMSFEIVEHDNGWTLITAHHSCIIGSVWLAYIKTESLPKIYECRFTGRAVGAIGAFSPFSLRVAALDEAGAKLAIYRTHEHLSELEIQPAKEEA